MSTQDGFSDNPLCAEMERRCTDMLIVSQAVVTCADVFEQACEPRAPKPEWFEKWPAWWIFATNGTEAVTRDIRVFQAYDKALGITYDCIRNGPDGIGYKPWWMIKDIEACLPIPKNGPGVVGWKVVGE